MLYRKLSSGLILFLIGFSLCFLNSCKNSSTSTRDETEKGTSSTPETSSIKLESLPSSETGINFVNQINDEGMINIFTWHFIYNGAGVAAGDINNDGLPDLYFAGNMVPDKLYLN